MIARWSCSARCLWCCSSYSRLRGDAVGHELTSGALARFQLHGTDGPIVDCGSVA
jgi:hypothetical protein